MLIGKNWKIESDSMNVTVFKRSYPKKKRDGTKTKGGWYPEAYLGTAKGALNYLVNQEVNETGLKDLQTVVSKIESLERKIEVALYGINLATLQVKKCTKVGECEWTGNLMEAK